MVLRDLIVYHHRKVFDTKQDRLGGGAAVTPTIYLAGPDVFLPNAPEIAARKRELCREFGFEGLFPDDAEQHTPSAIYRANRRLMEEADIGLFNLTPFRGPSADAGTVFELGYLAAWEKPVYGYTSSLEPYVTRLENTGGPLVEREDALWDQTGYMVEDFGLADNLMIVQAIQEAGGALVAVQGDNSDPLAAIAAFKECLKRMRKRYGSSN